MNTLRNYLLEKSINNLSDQLFSFTMKSIQVSQEISCAELDMVRTIGYTPVRDQGFVITSVVTAIRLYRITTFYGLKKSVENLEYSGRSIISQVNKLLLITNTPVSIDHSKPLQAINASKNISISNEEWGNQIDTAYSELRTYLKELRAAFNESEAVIRTLTTTPQF